MKRFIIGLVGGVVAIDAIVWAFAYMGSTAPGLWRNIEANMAAAITNLCLTALVYLGLFAYLIGSHHDR